MSALKATLQKGLGDVDKNLKRSWECAQYALAAQRASPSGLHQKCGEQFERGDSSPLPNSCVIPMEYFIQF